MNLPNKLTMLRIFMIPLFLLFIYIPAIPNHYLWALVVFAAASITDFLDGYIARKYKMITDFGKFMDPLADKLLTMAAMVAFIQVVGLHSLIVIVILGREFAVTALRTLAADNGIVIAADKLGKVKTVLQMIWIILQLVVLGIPAVGNIGGQIVVDIVMWLAVLFTVLSGANYLIKNKEVYMNSK